MSDPKKCENPACSCIPQKGESFCSPRCEAAKGTTEIMCQCGHPGCRGDSTT
jgi:hypothetical protein